MCGTYNSYRGKSAGRVLKYLYEICGLDVATRATVLSGEIHYPHEGSLFATYEWKEYGDGIVYPIFQFKDRNTREYSLMQAEIEQDFTSSKITYYRTWFLEELLSEVIHQRDESRKRLDDVLDIAEKLKATTPTSTV